MVVVLPIFTTKLFFFQTQFSFPVNMSASINNVSIHFHFIYKLLALVEV